MSEENQLEFSVEQARVLACLMEKHLATPGNYPLTPNSLTLACNQKSNRHPVMSLDEGRVVSTARKLNDMGFVSIDQGDRIVKFSHRAPGMFSINREQQAVLAMLMLREPLTLNDIKARTEKMVGFESLDQVLETVESLVAKTPALVMELPVAAGQREVRYTHLLAGEPDLSNIVVKASSPERQNQSQKMAELEARIEKLESLMDARNNQE